MVNKVLCVCARACVCVCRGVARNLLRGTKEEVWGRGPEAEPQWALGSKPPEAGDKC